MDWVVERLPAVARDEFLRRAPQLLGPPIDIDALFREVGTWVDGAGIAQGRGGYPGGSAPGWSDYVAEQMRNFAVYEGLIAVFGERDRFRKGQYGDYIRNLTDQAHASR